MKVVFVGPSLPDTRAIASADIDIRPPACQGDVMTAVFQGATSIGIIDGQFGYAAPVWHKEILFALSKNITVLGAASMGALRASECEIFGMIGIGAIFNDYISGRRDDDADVALIYGPAELGYPALSIPLVNVDATVSMIAREDLLDGAHCDRIRVAARALFFKSRTWKTIAAQLDMNLSELKPIIDRCWVDQKRLDALELLAAMEAPQRPSKIDEWEFNPTPLFRRLYI